MGLITKELSNLGTRAAFNRTLRHLVSVTGVIESAAKGINAADLLNSMAESGQINREQIAPMLSVALVSKFQYPFKSINIAANVDDFGKITSTFQKWNAVTMVVAYHHPNVGMVPINPANAEHWELVHDLKKDELLVIYAHTKDGKEDTAMKAIAGFEKLLMGREPVADPAFIDEMAKKAPPPPPPVAKPAASAQQAAPAAAKRKLTPKYSVQVTNELFHNGNVEAWKSIIESYETSHAGCNVIVYHEGELIQDLNALFKWGKVKHGGVILFQIAGVGIKNVSRLQKYLFEGASSRFESFLKHDLNKVLKLF